MLCVYLCCVCLTCMSVMSKTQHGLFAAGSYPSWITVQYFQEKMTFSCHTEYWLGQRERCLSLVSASGSSGGYSWLPRSLKDRRLKLHVASLLSESVLFLDTVSRIFCVCQGVLKSCQLWPLARTQRALNTIIHDEAVKGRDSAEWNGTRDRAERMPG